MRSRPIVATAPIELFGILRLDFSMAQPRLPYSLAALLLILGAGAGFAAMTPFLQARLNPVVAPSPPAPEAQPLAVIRPTESNFIVAAVQKVGPAVVRIDSSRKVKSQESEILADPFFRRFFGEEGGREPAPDQTERGSGSGFVLRKDGVILTNAHVVEDADQVRVKLKDGRSFAGKVMGQDPLTDVAVIKIETTELPIVPIGNSDQLQPGEWAIAIGNPLGLDNSVTVGIISATGRRSSDVGVSDKRVGFIQTDAAINPGNSGGPLLNGKGEVIGMNTAIIGNAQGLGFAIPINTASRLAQQLLSQGRVIHPYLGIQMVDITPELLDRIKTDPSAAGLNLKVTKGVVIAQVVAKSPAAIGGLRSGDVILKVGGKAVANGAEVQQQVEVSQVNQSLVLEINRNGKVMAITVKPGEFPKGRSKTDEAQP
jgi:S1-C subfamily serine protease